MAAIAGSMLVDGASLRAPEGTAVGAPLGLMLSSVSIDDGATLGRTLGRFGAQDGAPLGRMLGKLGIEVGAALGRMLGMLGIDDGSIVGRCSSTAHRSGHQRAPPSALRLA